MIVCICKNVNDVTIKRYTNVIECMTDTGAGTDCKTCLCTVKRLIKDNDKQIQEENMNTIRLNIGDTVTGQFGRHTSGESPDWEPTTPYTVTHVQKMADGDLVVIGGHEFHTKHDYEGKDPTSNLDLFMVEDTLFRFSITQ